MAALSVKSVISGVASPTVNSTRDLHGFFDTSFAPITPPAQNQFLNQTSLKNILPQNMPKHYSEFSDAQGDEASAQKIRAGIDGLMSSAKPIMYGQFFTNCPLDCDASALSSLKLYQKELSFARSDHVQSHSSKIGVG